MTEKQVRISPKLILNIEEKKKYYLVHLDGDMAPDDSKLFDLLTELVDKKLFVILDMSNVDYMNSACIGSLIRLLKKTREKNGNILISQLTPYLRKIFQIVALDKVFSIYESEEKAIGDLPL